MKRFYGTVVQQVVNAKSIVVMMLILVTSLSVACKQSTSNEDIDVGGKGKEIAETNATAIHSKEDVGGKGLGSSQGYSAKSSSLSFAFDVGGGKTVSTTKNTIADVGGRGAVNTGNLYVIFQNDDDVGGKSTGVMKMSANTLSDEVDGKQVKNSRATIPQSEFT